MPSLNKILEHSRAPYAKEQSKIFLQEANAWPTSLLLISCCSSFNHVVFLAAGIMIIIVAADIINLSSEFPSYFSLSKSSSQVVDAVVGTLQMII